MVHFPSAESGQTTSVEELVESARNGDSGAFAVLYADHVGQVRRYARRLVVHDRVEDLVAEAFARTWEQLVAGGGPRVAFMGYLRAVVLHLHLTRLRADQNLRWVADIEDSAMADPELAARILEDSPEHLVLERLFNERMKEALATLPDRWQRVLVMVYIENLPYREVAEHLETTVGAARQLSRRARAGMRKALSELADEEAAA
jgi:RNA polymerase sigma factor (sigma-70 family)